MDEYLRNLLKTYHLKVIYKRLHGKGYIVRKPGYKYGFVFVDSRLSDDEIEKVILHEIGHAENDESIVSDYKGNYRTRLCCESKANDFLIKEKVEEYVLDGYDVELANVVDFAKGLGVSDFDKIRSEFNRYLIQ